MRYEKLHILGVTVLLEGLLIAIFLSWAWYRGFHFDAYPTVRDIGIGLGSAVPLFVFNYLLFGPLSHRFQSLQLFFDFKDRVVRPLAAELDASSAVVVAIFAGVGEELFFRGVLQNECGLVLASLLFSLLHFGPAVRKYFLVAVVYALIGVYFGLLYSITKNLWVPIIAHAGYDYVALLYMRYAYVSPAPVVVPSRYVTGSLRAMGSLRVRRG